MGEPSHPGNGSASSELAGRLRTGGQRAMIAATAVLLAVAVVGLVLSLWHPSERVGPAELSVAPTAPPGQPAGRTVPPSVPKGPVGSAELPPGQDVGLELPRSVQVQLRSGENRLRVGCESRGRWRSQEAPAWTRRSEAGRWEVMARDGRIHLGGALLPAGGCLFVPEDGLFSLDGARYRGALQIEVQKGDRLRATEIVAVEQYLRGVVPAEMPPYWDMDALKAQAVAARSFVLYRAGGLDGGRSYLTAVDLAYGGVEAESSRSDAAVQRTRGIVMYWKDALFPGYFHSTCGGKTLSAAAVFGEANIPPLRGGECGWCTRSPHFRWEFRIPTSLLLSALERWGVQQVVSMRSLAPGAGLGRQMVLVNEQKPIPADTFRRSLGTGRLKSTKFIARQRKGDWVFFGWGWGHGAGMCQYGAGGMARAGRSWQQILAHYYPGARLVSLEEP